MEAAGGGSYRFLKRNRGRILLFFCLGTGTVWKQTVSFFVCCLQGKVAGICKNVKCKNVEKQVKIGEFALT